MEVGIGMYMGSNPRDILIRIKPKLSPADKTVREIETIMDCDLSFFKSAVDHILREHGEI